MEDEAAARGLVSGDLDELVLIDAYQSRHNGVSHFYVQQHFEGVPVHNAIASVSFLQNGSRLAAPHHFVPNLSEAIESADRGIEAVDAAYAAAAHLDLTPEESFVVIEERRGGPADDVLLNAAGISIEPIPVTLMYDRLASGRLRLAWLVGIYVPGGQHYWLTSVDAATGQILRQTDLVVHDHWDLIEDDVHRHDAAHEPVVLGTVPHIDALVPKATRSLTTSSGAGRARDGSQYRVYAMPLESPSHAGDPLDDLRTTEANAPHPTASPLGWHSTGGFSYTITRGNNVHAYTDTNASNTPDPGSEPDGGPSLQFDFPLDLTASPAEYADAAVTNLFYWNNVTHDVLYEYGFDEPAGNFQQNNFGLGGFGNDPVRAEAQDGSGLNNANFFTPPDGNPPRMQMFVWGVVPQLVVTAPPDIAGTYTASAAAFGPQLDTDGLSGTLAEAIDDTGSTLACSPITNNAAAIAGKIAVIDRGVCPFVEKVMHAQDAGAVGVLVVNTGAGVITMGGSDQNITIPSVMVSLSHGNAIRAHLQDGVEATMRLTQTPRDSDFDNGIIVHEYIHGLTHRLTGGPSTSSCLSNEQQAGEGWSDWYALMLTGGDVDDRGIGTYVRFQPPTGPGIRPARYSTSMTLNPYTFGNIGSLSIPHGVGFVFASMLWEMTQDLISVYGYDPDLYNGSGGNNIALQLVTDALKLQPCSPGFVDSRNAILQADVALTDGENECLIWDAFAKRGLGYSASQGSPFDATSGTEAFDVPDQCLAVGTDDEGTVDVLGLDPIYPNPATGAVTVRFQLPTAESVTIEVLDLLGRRVALLVDSALPAGTHERVWEGRAVGSGAYIIRLQSGGKQLTQRVTIVR